MTQSKNPLLSGGNPEIFRPLFIRLLSISGNITEAAELAGLTPQSVRLAMRSDKNFAQLVQTVLEDAAEILVDRLEKEAARRALAGSDLLMMFLLKKHRPEYRDKVLPQSLMQVNVKAYVGFSPDQWDDAQSQGQIVDSEAKMIDVGTTNESDLSVSAPQLADTTTS